MRIRTILGVLALGAATAASAQAQAQEKRPIVAEDLYRLRTASSVTVSPDGEWVVYTVTAVDSAENRYRRDLWLAAADGSERRRLTWTEDATESSPAFSPDGRYLAFVSRRDGDERSQIYVLPLEEPGEARPVTALETGASSPVWAPDSRRIAFTSALTPGERTGDADEEEATEDEATPSDRLAAIRKTLKANAEKDDPRVVTRLDYMAETSIRHRDRWAHIYIVDALAEDAEPVRVTDGDFSHSAPTWSPGGDRLVFSASPPKGDYHPDYERDSDLYVIAADGDAVRAAAEGNYPEPRNLTADHGAGEGVIPGIPGHPRTAWTEYRARFSPDGRRIAYARRITGKHYTAANTELVVMNADGTEPRCVSCDLDRSVRSFDWDEEDGDLYFTVADRGAVPLYRMEDGEDAPERIVDGPRGVLSFDVRDGTLAWAEMKPEAPSDVYAAEADGDDARRLTALNDSLLAAVHVQPYEELWYEAPDGEKIQGWVVRPPTFQPGRHPLAVEIHGGPHAMWGPGEQSMWLEYQMLAGAGYVVFFSNPRGSDGYGFEFKRVIHRNWGDLPMGDVLAGADSVLARGWADPDRQFVTGGSYAGYLTAWIVGHTDRFRAAVSQRGVYHMLGWYGGSNTWKLYEGEFSSLPWRDPELAWKASPIAYVENITTPLMLIHGERDYRTTMATAEMLYRALTVLGREVEFVRYPREGHELSRSGEPHHRVDRLLRILEYFERHDEAPAASATQ